MYLVLLDGFGCERAHQAAGESAQGQALHERHAPTEVLRSCREEGARRVIGYLGLHGGGGLRDLRTGAWEGVLYIRRARAYSCLCYRFLRKAYRTNVAGIDELARLCIKRLAVQPIRNITCCGPWVDQGARH